VIAVVAVAVTIYYLWWRVTETFNPNALFFSWSLWLAEVFGFFTTLLFYFTVWKPTTRKAPEAPEGLAVDVFIPTLNEPVTVLRKTLLACNDMTYPHRTVVLDDGGRDEVRRLCEELGCAYLRRSNRRHAKAGNLNYGLEHSTAEFIAVFDADHAPLPHFLDRLLGYFEDEKVGFVQAPQEFYNIDSFQHRVDRRKQHVWSEQGLFYYIIQPGRDHWNAAYFVGTCAIIRRKALDDIDGFQTQSITEDMLTSIRLQAEGWGSVYHNEPLAFGIAPETIRPFHIQRRRWGVGGWQVFFKANPLFLRGLSFPQRLCYLASLIYPFEGFQKLVFYVTPPIALFTGILPMHAMDIYYLLHFVPYYAISIYAFNEMGRGYGGNLMLEQFSMGKFVTYISSLFAFLLPKRSRTFTVTPKGDGTSASSRYLVPQIIVVVVSLAAIAFALVELLLARRSDEFIIAVNSLWALYNTGLGIAIIQYARKKVVQRRADFRVTDSVPLFYRWENGKGREKRLGVAADLTSTGLSIITVGEPPAADTIDLELILPKGRVETIGYLSFSRSVGVNGDTASRIGVRLNGMPPIRRDRLSRYLTGLSTPKYLGGFTTRYETYLERRLGERPPFFERAPRTRALIPVVIVKHDNRPAFGAMQDVSKTGCLVETQCCIPEGTGVTIQAVIGTDIVELGGTVARMTPYESPHFPEALVGVKFDDPGSAAARRIVRIAGSISGLVEP
jgi:cellulose synthase (UDP-forming)